MNQTHLYIALSAIFVLSVGLIYLNSLLARQKGESPVYWSLVTVMGWGFDWIALRELTRYLLRHTASAEFIRLAPILAGSALLVYALIWWLVRVLLMLKPDAHDLLAEIEELGKPSE